MSAIAAVLLVAALILCVRSARQQAERSRDERLARGLASMRYMPEVGEADALAGRWGE